MKKWLFGILGTLSITSIIYIFYTKWNVKKNIAVIGGSDGPTSIFIATKTGTLFSTCLLLVGFILIILGITIFLILKKRK